MARPKPTPHKATFEVMQASMGAALDSMEVLCGNEMSDTAMSWQQIAGVTADYFRTLADQLEQVSLGNHEACIVFPSPSDHFYKD